MAPFDRYLASLKPGDSVTERMRKLLESYGMRREPGGFVRVCKQGGGDLSVDDLDEDDIDDGKQDDGEPGSTSSRHISHLAALISEATGAERERALDWLLHTRDGLMLIQRTLGKRLNKRKETQPMSRNEELASIAKRHGVPAVAKHIIDNGPSGISEHELVAMVEAQAKASGTSFAKMFTANDDDGLLLRKAVGACKTFATAPAHKQAVGSSGALAALEEKAAALRKAHPEMTREQSFAKIYTDPSNVGLVAWERQENRPRA
jgi:hypothetical protein